MTEANLVGADLRGARLRQALLKGADLTRVRLDEDTELDQAYFVDAIVFDVDFSEIISLTKRQLVDAIGNKNTVLPKRIDACKEC